MNTTKQKTDSIETYKKEYVYMTDYHVSNDGHYKMPCIRFYRLGQKYEQGRYCSSCDFEFEYQITLINDNGSKNENQYAYGGRLENCHISEIENVSKISQAMDKAITKLEIHNRCAYLTAITALRAAGYRQGIKSADGYHISNIE